jgi:hypothetical protein
LAVTCEDALRAMLHLLACVGERRWATWLQQDLRR